MNKINAVVFDWAGTTVDFGSFAPVDAFTIAFEAYGVTPTIEEIRAPMGLPKRKHIERMLEGRRLAELWRVKHGAPPVQEDVDGIYARFEPALFGVIEKHAEPLPDVPRIVRELRAMGIAIGSTTGYNKAMMDTVAPLAKSAGYEPDVLVCPDDVGGVGRPYPYMLWRNLEKLGVQSIGEALKVGDTAVDIWEGKNAGCLSVGIVKGSSMLGLNASEYETAKTAELPWLSHGAERGYKDVGADHVIADITELPDLIRRICGGLL
ncbi:MAG: phosphonoacetaldehyde hydrolase [Clostridiales Family XIII bacterium]|jgi:phosphonoacetaldehyde hydrolase|nr:phosphonoacetaldehyde hydrolase [Clostridiales Family XIII bacterium]